MEFLSSLYLASEAKLVALTGLGFVLLAGFSLLMERRRSKGRSLERLEKVGWVPWTGLFVAFAVIGGGMLAMSVPVVLGNL